MNHTDIFVLVLDLDEGYALQDAINCYTAAVEGDMDTVAMYRDTDEDATFNRGQAVRLRRLSRRIELGIRDTPFHQAMAEAYHRLKDLKPRGP